MDTATVAFYATHAPDVVRRYEAVDSPVARFFGTAFASGCRVLDVGAGSGRDLAALLSLGYDAYGAEPVEAMAAGAISSHPQLAGRIANVGLPVIEPTMGIKPSRRFELGNVAQ
jgi:SAM-dependent methyltransferase